MLKEWRRLDYDSADSKNSQVDMANFAVQKRGVRVYVLGDIRHDPYDL